MVKKLKRPIAQCITVIVLITSSQLPSQETKDTGIVARAVADAEADAEKDINRITWLGCGCIFTVYTLGAAYLIVPSPKQERLMGKSYDYVWAYTQAYKSRRRALQLRYALIGTGISSVIVITALVIVVSKEGKDGECCTGPDLSCGLEGCGSSESCGSSDGCSFLDGSSGN
ncbi:MAG: hypothetical protein E3J87_06285 [Candidatus Cloacimonadota bacterium]|nr:MAG: hypothetical protein E3J87_06285 [Candidatus Cloacimonadota bacterium]